MFQKVLISILLLMTLQFRAQQVILKGHIHDAATGQVIPHAFVKVLSSTYVAETKGDGSFELRLPRKLHYSILVQHVAYHKKMRELDVEEKTDTVNLDISLKMNVYILDSVAIRAVHPPDTLVGNPKYSIYDFDFYEDKYLLLTAAHALTKAEVRLVDDGGITYAVTVIPEAAGEAKEFYHDFMGYTNVFCEHALYRIRVINQEIVLAALPMEDYNSLVKPILDTLDGQIIFSDYWREYPSFNYYTYDQKDSSRHLICNVTNEDLMHAYNFEYYSMPSKNKLAARRLAMELHTDKHITAALMSGFTQSMFYEPLFAPLYVVEDTMCVFDHYKDLLFHFDRRGNKLDSMKINYHHPKNWREWKRLMVMDPLENKIYAIYDRNGHKYIKYINNHNGQAQGQYTLQFHSAEKMKVRDGFVYYIYRPFDSTQERFLYREMIKLE